MLSSAEVIRLLGVQRCGLAEQQALGLDGQDDGDHDEQEADHRGAGDVEVVVVRDERERHRHEREGEAEERRHVLEEDDRQLGLLRVPDERGVRRVAAHVVGLPDRRAQRQALQHDGHAEDDEGDPPPPARVLVVTRPDLVELVVGLVEREQPADGEQHDRDDEGVDVALAPVPERVLLGRLAAGSLAAQQQEQLVPGVGHGVDRLGQHRADPGEEEGQELGRGDACVRQQGSHDRPGATVSRHRARVRSPPGRGIT